MKTVKLLFKIGGCVLIVLGAVCLVVGYLDQLKALCPCKKKAEVPEEFADFADVE